MKLYYTTSVGTDEVQTKPSISLGGFKSSSLVRNNDYDNLFGELSVYTINKNQDEYIALMLHNDLGNDVENVELYFVHPEGCYAKYQVAGVIPTVNGDGDSVIERIPTRYSQPLYAEFEDATEAAPYDLGTLEDGAMLGIWIKRSLLMDIINTDSSDLYQVDPDNPHRFVPKEASTSDSIQIVINWDDVVVP